MESSSGFRTRRPVLGVHRVHLRWPGIAISLLPVLKAYMVTEPMAQDSTHSQPRLLLGRIGPAVVLLCLVLDISLRLLPPGFITFRAWEAVTLFATGTGPFVPNVAYRSTRSSGDLANLANLPHSRQYRCCRLQESRGDGQTVHGNSAPWRLVCGRFRSF